MQNFKILLVEDEEKLARTLQQGLSEKGYQVEIGFDGLSGEKLFRNGEFDLVILDINLPLLNGLVLCERIRAANKNVPVLMLTTFGSVDDKLDGFNAGADDYLVKPFAFDELVARIRAVLRRGETRTAEVDDILKLADLELNLATKRVKRAGKYIRLTAKEFQLLEYFLRNKNRVVSRADIGEHVWDIDFDTGTNTIDVFINYLRNKIDKNFEEKLIHTEYGFGYIMREGKDQYENTP